MQKNNVVTTVLTNHPAAASVNALSPFSVPVLAVKVTEMSLGSYKSHIMYFWL